MFFVKRSVRMLLLPLLAGLLLAACKSAGGTVSDDFHEAGRALDFTRWSGRRTLTAALGRDDGLEIEIDCESGGVALDIRGENGVEAYSGNDLRAARFTVYAPAAGVYVITVTGKKATGRMDMKTPW